MTLAAVSVGLLDVTGYNQAIRCARACACVYVSWGGGGSNQSIALGSGDFPFFILSLLVSSVPLPTLRPGLRCPGCTTRDSVAPLVAMSGPLPESESRPYPCLAGAPHRWNTTFVSDLLWCHVSERAVLFCNSSRSGARPSIFTACVFRVRLCPVVQQDSRV